MASFKRRKGQLAAELLFIVIFLLGMGLTLIMANMTQKNINNDLQSDNDIQNITKTNYATTTANYAPAWDNAILILIVLFWIFLLISSYYIETHPAFFIINLLIIIISLSVVIIMANTYTDITTDNEITTFAADFPKLNFIMDHILITILIMALSVGVVLYAK